VRQSQDRADGGRPDPFARKFRRDYPVASHALSGEVLTKRPSRHIRAIGLDRLAGSCGEIHAVRLARARAGECPSVTAKRLHRVPPQPSQRPYSQGRSSKVKSI
jgi:hypothetical protein